MISYQWGNQEIIKRIVHELRAAGFPVWLDIDYMGGSTLQVGGVWCRMCGVVSGVCFMVCGCCPTVISLVHI